MCHDRAGWAIGGSQRCDVGGPPSPAHLRLGRRAHCGESSAGRGSARRVSGQAAAGRAGRPMGDPAESLPRQRTARATTLASDLDRNRATCHFWTPSPVFGQVRDHELDQRPATRPQPRALQNLGQDGRLLGSRRPRPNPVSPRRPRTDGRAVLREFRRPSLETSTRLPGHPFGATYGALTSAYPITVVPSSPYTGRGGCRVPSEVSSGRVPSSTVARLVVSSL